MNNKKSFENLKRIFIFTSGGVGYHVIDRFLYHQENIQEAAAQGIIDSKIENIKNQTEVIQIKKEVLQSEIADLHLMVKEHYNLIKECATAYKNRKSDLITLSKEETLDKLNNIKEQGKSLSSVFQKLKTDKNWEDNGAYEKIKDFLIEIDDFAKYVKNEDLNNKLVSGFNKLYQYLDTLTLLQEVSLLHILMFCVLIFTVINILSVLFGNEIIRFLDLEKRFPKLSTFFRLRATLQKYYLIWNVIILFVFCLFGIGINILIFTST